MYIFRHPTKNVLHTNLDKIHVDEESVKEELEKNVATAIAILLMLMK